MSSYSTITDFSIKNFIWGGSKIRWFKFFKLFIVTAVKPKVFGFIFYSIYFLKVGLSFNRFKYS
jgi:hypothetical protein